MESERRLVARLVAGDDRALGRAYDQYAPLVFGIAARLVGDEAAADITQEVFVALWQHPDRVDLDRGTLRTFLATVARRRAIDSLRRRQRHVVGQERVEAQSVVAPPDVEEAATAMLLGERVRDAVRALRPDQRRAVELAYFEGLTYREVAERLAIPEGTAKSRLRLGLARLGNELHTEVSVGWT